MTNNWKFYLIIVLVASSIDLAWSICKTTAEIDATYGMETEYFGNRQVIIPFDQNKLKEHCSTYKDGFNGIKEYTATCLTGVAKGMGLNFVKNLNAHYDKRCTDPDFGSEFIEHNQCFKDAAILEEFHKCTDRWFQMMDQLKNIPESDLVQSSCCIYQQFQQCVQEKNINLCHDKNARFWNQALDDMTDEAIEMYCGGLNSLDDCNARFPKDQWAAITGPVDAMDAAKLKSRNKWRSPFFVLVDALSKYSLQ